MPGRPRKEFQQYITSATDTHINHSEYLHSPATAFLKYVVSAKSSVDLCVRQFPKNSNGSYSKASKQSLQHIVAAMLPAVMGHFETYQRYLFAGVFDKSVLLNDFDVESFFKKLSKETSFTFDPIRLAAHRKMGASSIGTLLSDSLSGWHDPRKVNSYLHAFGLEFQFFDNDAISSLKTLWQLRHSMVHTGGTLTLADAQKVNQLKEYGGRTLGFENNFTFEIARKLHPLVKRSTEGFGDRFNENLIPTVDEVTRSEVAKFFEVKSTVAVWLS